MKKKIILTYLFLLIFSVTHGCISDVGVFFFKNETRCYDKLDEVVICKWKRGAEACVNLSFDDNNKSAKQISKYLDSFGFKGTFFFNTGFAMDVDSIKDMILSGHEIGNHTFNHERFSEMDSTQIEFNIKLSKTILENTFGIKCVSFAEPGHIRTELGTKLIFKNHLFCRNYSEYSDLIQKRVPFSSLKDTIPLVDSIKDIINKNLFLKLSGHGLNNDGYDPTPAKLLNDCLKLIKRYSDEGKIWVTTLKEGSLYEDLYKELFLKKTVVNDTLGLFFENFNRNKYKDMYSAPISVEIPYDFASDISLITGEAIIERTKNKFILTLDLQKDSFLLIKLNKNDSVIGADYRSLILYPNPAKTILNIIGDTLNLQNENIAYIYDCHGHLIDSFKIMSGSIDVSKLKSGVYLFQLHAKKTKNDSKLVLQSKFIKL